MRSQYRHGEELRDGASMSPTMVTSLTPWWADYRAHAKTYNSNGR